MAAPESTPRRGRPKKLRFDDAVDAALAVMDADGVDAVSLRRVGAELGVSHMTLYTYFDSKESLLNAMVARTLDVPALTADFDGSWDERLIATMRQTHDVLMKRPGIAQLLVTHQFDGQWVGEIREHLLELLAPAGLSKPERVDAISVLFNYLFGTVMVESSRGLGGSPGAFEHGLQIIVGALRQASR
jgi:AcrR family transcriptional regulator